MKSIMHDRADRTCYLCIDLHGDYSEHQMLHEHHVVFGTANRRLSQKFGLMVYLCPWHHEFSEEAVHENQSIRRKLEKKAQIAFTEKWPELNFMQIFGKNFLTVEERKAILRKSATGSIDGFKHIETGIDSLPF